ncbi:unnamed protein product [Lactuca saligna]|uniref:Uncharacterized protein n=1 Tax=Lactuca saligna TaxID=75948 RepID=A0AA35YMT6_LACSI|nr:unnamed protein product [Lactuca saligna]
MRKGCGSNMECYSTLLIVRLNYHRSSLVVPPWRTILIRTVWSKKAIEREKNVDDETSKGEEGAGTSKKNRPTSANSNAVKLSCEKLRLFVSEAVHRAATIAEAEVSDFQPRNFNQLEN